MIKQIPGTSSSEIEAFTKTHEDSLENRIDLDDDILRFHLVESTFGTTGDFWTRKGTEKRVTSGTHFRNAEAAGD